MWSYQYNEDVRSVAISSDGTYIAVGSWDDNVSLFRKDGGGTPEWSYDAGSSVWSVDITPDGEYIAAGSYGEVYLYENSSSTPLNIWNTGGNSTKSISISSDGNYIAADDDDYVYLLQRGYTTPSWSFYSDDCINSVSISSDGDYIAAGKGFSETEGDVYLFQKDSNLPLWTYHTSTNVESVAISSDGIYIVAGDDETVYLFDKTLPVAVPSPPTGLTATPGDGEITLSWTTVTNASGYYDVYRSTTSGSDFSKINPTLVTETTYKDTTVINDVTYYYHVKAVRDGVESSPSSELSAIATVSGSVDAVDGIEFPWLLIIIVIFFVMVGIGSGIGYKMGAKKRETVPHPLSIEKREIPLKYDNKSSKLLVLQDEKESLTGATMKCFTCNKELQEGWVSCPFCGKNVEKIASDTNCKKCGSGLDENWITCPLCGLEVHTEKSIIFCSKCKNELDDKWISCPFCGNDRSQNLNNIAENENNLTSDETSKRGLQI